MCRLNQNFSEITVGLSQCVHMAALHLKTQQNQEECCYQTHCMKPYKGFSDCSRQPWPFSTLPDPLGASWGAPKPAGRYNLSSMSISGSPPDGDDQDTSPGEKSSWPDAWTTSERLLSMQRSSSTTLSLSMHWPDSQHWTPPASDWPPEGK